MAVSRSPGLLPLSPLKPLWEKIARLAGADALALLPSLPVSGGEPRWLPLVTCGRQSLTSQPGLETFLIGIAGSGSMTEVPTELAASLGLDASLTGFAAPLIEERDGTLLGGVMLGFPHAAADAQRAKAAIDVLGQLAAHEMLCEGMARSLAHAKALSVRHVERRERERQALANEIHDDLSQNVTFIRLALSSLQRQLDEGRLERAKAEVNDLVAASVLVKDGILRLSTGLRPAMIETLGPSPAIRHEAQLHHAATGVPVNCDLDELPVPAAVSIAAYRIIQESLSNVARHAKASEVNIRLERHPGRLVFKVEDNGCGFDPDAVPASLGLLSMIERAEIAGGTLIIRSRPGEGTQVIASFPEAAIGHIDNWRSGKVTSDSSRRSGFNPHRR